MFRPTDRILFDPSATRQEQRIHMPLFLYRAAPSERSSLDRMNLSVGGCRFILAVALFLSYLPLSLRGKARGLDQRKKKKRLRIGYYFLSYKLWNLQAEICCDVFRLNSTKSTRLDLANRLAVTSRVLDCLVFFSSFFLCTFCYSVKYQFLLVFFHHCV